MFLISDVERKVTLERLNKAFSKTIWHDIKNELPPKDSGALLLYGYRSYWDEYDEDGYYSFDFGYCSSGKVILFDKRPNQRFDCEFWFDIPAFEERWLYE